MDNRLVEIYIKKFIKGQIDFDGIILTPRIDKENFKEYRIFWSFSNPNDVSYSEFAIIGRIEQTLEEYFELIGDPFAAIYNRRRIVRERYINFEDNLENIYLSPKLQRNIEDKLVDEVFIKLRHIQFKVKGFDYYASAYHEEISFETSMMVYDVVDTKTNKVLDEKEIVDFFNNIYEDGDEQDLYDTVNSHISDLLFRLPTIYDKEESYLRDTVTFYDENKDIYSF